MHVCRGLEIIHPSLQCKADEDKAPDITVCIGSAIINLINSFAVNTNVKRKKIIRK